MFPIMRHLRQESRYLKIDTSTLDLVPLQVIGHAQGYMHLFARGRHSGEFSHGLPAKSHSVIALPSLITMFLSSASASNAPWYKP